MTHIETKPAFSTLIIAFTLLLSLGNSCRDAPANPSEPIEDGPAAVEEVLVDTVIPEAEPEPLPPLDQLPDSAFVRLADYSDGFAYEMRYATDNNFLGEVVYPCGECYTRVRTARALLQVNEALAEGGVRIRFFDCYRPNSVQYQMWELVPNPQYVANPVTGSIHNRGGAVDITLETLEGKPLDMGTDFDFFGPRAHHDYTDLPAEVLENRTLLKQTMEAYGFRSVRTEWWHYNLAASTGYPVADFVWPCPE